MRLNQEQRTAIEVVFKKVFSHGELVLFGSRVDDAKKGGDIDLFIDPEENAPDLFERKITFLVELKNLIGEQKIDLVMAPFAPSNLQNEIKKTGIKLCKI